MITSKPMHITRGVNSELDGGSHKTYMTIYDE